MFTGTSATLGAAPVLNGETIFLMALCDGSDTISIDKGQTAATASRVFIDPTPLNATPSVMTLTADTPTTSVPTSPLTPAMTVIEALLKQPIDPTPDPCGYRDPFKFDGITIPSLDVDTRFARHPSRSTRQRPVDNLELS